MGDLETSEDDLGSRRTVDHDRVALVGQDHHVVLSLDRLDGDPWLRDGEALVKAIEDPDGGAGACHAEGRLDVSHLALG